MLCMEVQGYVLGQVYVLLVLQQKDETLGQCQGQRLAECTVGNPSKCHSHLEVQQQLSCDRQEVGFEDGPLHFSFGIPSFLPDSNFSLWISLCTREFLSLDTLYIHPLDINYSFVSRGTAFTAAPPPTHPSHPPTCLSPSAEQFSWSDTPYIVLVFLWCPLTRMRAS